MCSFRLTHPDDAAPRPIPSGDVLPPQVLLRINSAADRVHALGCRVSTEAWAQIARGPTGPDAVLQLLTDFARLTPQQLVAAGADRPIPRLLEVVQ